MPVLKNKTQGNYVNVCKDIMMNHDLSLRDRGTLVTLLSLPDNWEFTISGLSKIIPDGKSSIRSSMAHLEELGYITRIQDRAEHGKFGNIILEIHEKPVNEKQDSPLSDLPHAVKPSTANPSSGNRTQYINNKYNNNKYNISTNVDIVETPEKASEVSTADAHETENDTTLPEQNADKQDINRVENNDTGKKEHIDYSMIQDCYNKICVSLPHVKAMTNDRRKKIKTLLNELEKLKIYPDVSPYEKLSNLFAECEKSDFLTGRSGRWNGCSFDWIINKNNALKIIEGNYINKGSMSGNHNAQNAFHDFIQGDEIDYDSICPKIVKQVQKEGDRKHEE